MNYFKIFETRVAGFRIWKFSETDFVWFSLNYLECFIVWNACRQKLKLLAKNWLFGELFQSRKWIEKVHNFKARNACLEKLKIFANRFSIKESWLSQFFEAWVACMKKMGTNLVYEATWKKFIPIQSMKGIDLLQSFIYQIACLKKFRLSKIWFSP